MAQQAPQLGPAPRATAEDLTATSQRLPHAARLPALDRTDRQAVVNLFRDVYSAAITVPHDWTGSVEGCTPGTTSTAYAAATLDMVNYFRAMTGLPASVAHEPVKDAKAQHAALMMSANHALSHSPPPSWNCYSADGAEAAGKSNLALGAAGPRAVSLYIEDPGDNNKPMGHRRWILYPRQVEMGTGSTADANDLWVISAFGTRPATTEFVAWPPAAFVPYQLVYPRWSFSVNTSATVSFATATVSMTHRGLPLPLEVYPLADGYGDSTIVWQPAEVGFVPGDSDQVVSVHVNGVVVGGTTKDYSYDVTVIDAGPSPPTGYSAYLISSSGFWARWGGVTGAAGYRLDVSLSPTFDNYVSGYEDLDVGLNTSWKVSGLEQATEYFYRVRAYWPGGVTRNSATISVTTSTAPNVPGAPTGVSGSWGDSRVVLTWTPPGNDGGASLTGYSVQFSTSPGGSYVPAPGCPSDSVVPGCTATSLVNGTSYYFRVAAINANGRSPYSLASDAVKPIALPVFTDEPLNAPSVPVRAAHITQLRTAIALLRARYGLSGIAWTDSSLAAGATVVKVVHVTELRDALAAVYTAAGRSVPAYAHALLPQKSVISAVDVAELRVAVEGIW